jgi:hypothetical protein
MDEIEVNALCDELGMLVNRVLREIGIRWAGSKKCCRFERTTTDRYVNQRRINLLLDCEVWFSGPRSSRSVGPVSLIGLLDDIAKLRKGMQQVVRRERSMRGVMQWH